MFWKGKDMFCLEDMSHLAVSFVRKIGQFFWDTNPPESMGNIFLGRGLWPILSLKLWRGNPKIWDWKIRKIWVSGFNVINFAGAFIGDLEVSSWKKIGFFPVISWSADELRIPPSQTWKLKLSDSWGRSALRNTCPNCQLAVARLSRVFLLDLCWTLFEVAKKRWLWKAVKYS